MNGSDFYHTCTDIVPLSCWECRKMWTQNTDLEQKVFVLTPKQSINNTRIC